MTPFLMIVVTVSAVLTPLQVSPPTLFCGDSMAGAQYADCLGSGTSVVPGVTGVNNSGSTRSGSGASGPSRGKKYVPYMHLDVDDQGRACTRTVYVEVDPDAPPTQPTLGQTDFYGVYPECPPLPSDPGQPAPVETPLVLATRYWERVSLPMPRPHIAPGRAITGKLAYLETNNRTSYTYTNDTVFGPLEIVATGRYFVDWGDGNTSGPHAGEGGPWPDGSITHQYIDVGNYNVVVTERWTATWRLGGESGVLHELRTSGRIDNFPVQQIQAVVYR